MGKQSYKRFELVFDIFRDEELIKRLEEQPNKADYIRRLIQEDLEKEKASN